MLEARPAEGLPDEANAGQILVLFTLCLVALLGFAGLALDGGSRLRRSAGQQTAADLAALAAPTTT